MRITKITKPITRLLPPVTMFANAFTITLCRLKYAAAFTPFSARIRRVEEIFIPRPNSVANKIMRGNEEKLDARGV